MTEAANATTDSANTSFASARLWRGFGWGVAATVVMSIPMLIGMATGVAPMPEPIPKALVTLVLGTDVSPPS